ncbi:hypothetical protein JHK85_019030 [Glycine max]|nr:hypothetical protein JHK85_019030 [Glycine max]
MMQNMEWVASLQHWKIVTVMGYYYLRFSQEKDQQMKHLKVSACMGIYHFTALALPNHVMEIIDPLLLPKQEFDDRDEEFSAKEKAMLRENEPEVALMMSVRGGVVTGHVEVSHRIKIVSR